MTTLLSSLQMPLAELINNVIKQKYKKTVRTAASVQSLCRSPWMDPPVNRGVVLLKTNYTTKAGSNNSTNCITGF